VLHMMIKCPDCGKKISKNAMICPHCKCSIAAFRKLESKPCRICGTPLLVKDHLAIEYKSTPWIIDRSSVTEHLKYTPCPQCGEPRPILQAQEKSPLNKIVVAAVLLAIAVIAGFVYLKFGGS
ncbi:MAG TPA: hypothetical protein VFW53_07415, partial [Gallionella sp.]|nr:hypothetical protein [Gallionella sp.]